jgi:hypothetical protein
MPDKVTFACIVTPESHDGCPSSHSSLHVASVF